MLATDGNSERQLQACAKAWPMEELGRARGARNSICKGMRHYPIATIGLLLPACMVLIASTTCGRQKAKHGGNNFGAE